jgi:phosphotriesterase-related protein
MKTDKLEGKVQTVLGPINSGQIGITTSHEHILWDMSGYFQEPLSATEKEMAREPVNPNNLWWVRAHAAGNMDNIRQTDLQLAINEVSRFKIAGGGTIVEVTLDGLSRDPSGLVRVARATGVNIIMGSGYYSGFTHPENMDQKTESDIVEKIIREITIGVRDSGVCAGIIGEIGCSVPFTNNERKVLRASAIAQQKTGAPINVHPSINDDLVLENINVLEDAGADLSRVAISHVDGFEFNESTIHKILKKGCYVEYDGFGHTMYHQVYMDRIVNEGNDIQRIYDINRLINEGYLNQILIGQDVFFKCSLATYGGFGYAHIIDNLIPLMRLKGLTEHQIHTLFIENPRRFLTFNSAKS